MGSAATLPLYYRKLYLNRVSQAYDELKLRFELHPQLAVPDSDNVVKNFGNTRWNDVDFESEEDLQEDNAIGVFDGDDLDDRRMKKLELLDSL